jgi:predicted amino acid dehydrogenase
LIGVPFGAREMMNLPREETLGVIKKAVELGRELGAEIVGLGALTSVVSRGGRALTGQGVAITSGNSFTTLMAMEALLAGARKMRIDFTIARGAVLGATGSIGRACALLLSQDITNIVLLGNPRHPRSSRNRLNSLTLEILVLAYQRRSQGIITGLSEWLDGLINSYRKKDELRSLELEKALSQADGSSLELIKGVCREMAMEFPLEISMDLDASLPQCDMIVAASNSPEFIVYPRHLQPGAVVCDVARPADVAPEVRERDDVLVLEGGLVSYPEPVAFGPNLGYRDGVNLGCLSETILLALEGDCRDFSIGSRLSLDTIEYLRRLGEKHGFTLAGLMTGNREIGDKEIEEIYRKSLSFKQANNL